MSLKLKLVLGFFVVLAAFFGYRSLQSISTPNKAGLANINSVAPALKAQISETVLDSDHDGIPDLNETAYGTNIFKADTDGDGYLDGEEVASGHDPLKANDDAKTKKKQNLTDLFARRLVAGAAAGDLNPKNGKGATYQNGINLISLAILDAAKDRLASDPEAQKVHTIPPTKEAIEDYRVFLQTTLYDPTFISTFRGQLANLQRAFALFGSGKPAEGAALLRSDQKFFDSKKQAFIDTPVPEPFAPLHKMFATRFSELANAYGALADSKESNDIFLRDASLKQIGESINGLRTDLSNAIFSK